MFVFVFFFPIVTPYPIILTILVIIINDVDFDNLTANQALVKWNANIFPPHTLTRYESDHAETPKMKSVTGDG